MVLRNSLKVLSTNFSLVWKNLAYILVVVAIFGGAIVGIGYNIVQTLASAGFFESFGEFWGKLYSMSATEISSQLVEFVGSAYDIIVENIDALALNIAGVCAVLFVMIIVLNAVSVVNGDVLRGGMSSLTRVGFCGAYVRYLFSALWQGVIKTLIKLPFWAIICVSGYFVLNLMSTSALWGVVAPMLFVMITLVVLSIESTLLSCFVPHFVLHSDGINKSFVRGINVVSHRFWRTLSNVVVFTIFAFVVNFVCARYTFGVSLLITLPITSVLLSAMFMVNYYESQGMRYYLDSSNIVNPRKFAEQDRAKAAKFVI